MSRDDWKHCEHEHSVNIVQRVQIEKVHCEKRFDWKRFLLICICILVVVHLEQCYDNDRFRILYVKRTAHTLTNDCVALNTFNSLSLFVSVNWS